MWAGQAEFAQEPGQVKGRIDFPAKLAFLFKPSRYKILYGGRGSGKSWGVARYLLLEGARRPLRVLCARELQNSLDESVHKLLSAQIEKLGLEHIYEVQNTVILGKNGTEFIFKGMRHNIQSVKSFEDIDVVWWEEAHTASKKCLEVLIPTIRKKGSELIFTFNPELETDEVYKRFIINVRDNAKVVKVNWSDNPWLTDELRTEMEALKKEDEDAYLNVWEGHCKQTLDGAIYARELRAATAGGRIAKVPYEASKPVHAFFDLGWRDSTSIWLAQAVGFEHRILRYIEDRQRTIEHYAQLLKTLPYVIGDVWLPHDAQATTLAAGGRTVEGQLRSLGFKVRIIPRLSIADGINAARTIFPNCYFDAEGCADGLNALRRYRYEVDEETRQFSKRPLHDESSHAADAFRYLAISLRERRASSADIIQLNQHVMNFRRHSPPSGSGGWMGS